MTLSAQEFLRRFFLHLLPRGFVRIRHYGLLTNRFRNQSLALARTLLTPIHQPSLPTAQAPQNHQHSALWHCPRCGGTMHVSRRLSPMEINSS